MIRLKTNATRLACVAVAMIGIIGFMQAVNAETTIYSTSGEVLAQGDVAICLPDQAVCQEPAKPECQYPSAGPNADCATCKLQEQCVACCDRQVKAAADCKASNCGNLPKEPDNEYCFKVDKDPKYDGDEAKRCLGSPSGNCENKQDCKTCCANYKTPSQRAKCQRLCDGHWASMEPEFVIVVE